MGSKATYDELYDAMQVTKLVTESWIEATFGCGCSERDPESAHDAIKSVSKRQVWAPIETYVPEPVRGIDPWLVNEGNDLRWPWTCEAILSDSDDSDEMTDECGYLNAFSMPTCAKCGAARQNKFNELESRVAAILQTSDVDQTSLAQVIEREKYQRGESTAGVHFTIDEMRDEADYQLAHFHRIRPNAANQTSAQPEVKNTKKVLEDKTWNSLEILNDHQSLEDEERSGGAENSTVRSQAALQPSLSEFLDHSLRQKRQNMEIERGVPGKIQVTPSWAPLCPGTIFQLLLPVRQVPQLRGRSKDFFAEFIEDEDSRGLRKVLMEYTTVYWAYAESFSYRSHLLNDLRERYRNHPSVLKVKALLQRPTGHPREIGIPPTGIPFGQIKEFANNQSVSDGTDHTIKEDLSMGAQWESPVVNSSGEIDENAEGNLPISAFQPIAEAEQGNASQPASKIYNSKGSLEVKPSPFQKCDFKLRKSTGQSIIRGSEGVYDVQSANRRAEHMRLKEEILYLFPKNSAATLNDAIESAYPTDAIYASILELLEAETQWREKNPEREFHSYDIKLKENGRRNLHKPKE